MSLIDGMFTILCAKCLFWLSLWFLMQADKVENYVWNNYSTFDIRTVAGELENEENKVQLFKSTQFSKSGFGLRMLGYVFAM